jgi:hypothetical protein
MCTSRIPAFVLGVPTVAFPSGQETPRRTRIKPLPRSMSARRGSAISPYRRAHQAPSRTARRRRAGRASTIATNSSSDVVLTSCARVTCPAPVIWHGMVVTIRARGSAAVAKMAFSSW